MSGYLLWLAPQIPTLRPTLSEAFYNARIRAAKTGTHLRIPEVLAHLWVGLDCGLSYATEIGACGSERADELREQGWQALVERALAQSRLIEEEKPTGLFLRVLATLVTQRRVQLLPKDQCIDRDYSGSPVIGWHDLDYLYLLPEAAFQAVGRFVRDAGETFPVSEQTLRHDLVQEEVAVHEKGRKTISARVGGGTHRVLKLRRALVEAAIGADFPLPSPVVTGVTGFGE
jgi:hypothetical protein